MSITLLNPGPRGDGNLDEITIIVSRFDAVLWWEEGGAAAGRRPSNMCRRIVRNNAY